MSTGAVGAIVSVHAPHSSPAAVEAGRGRLRIVRVRDRSVVSSAYATSPLRLLTPRAGGEAAWIFTSSYGGGLVDGDHLGLDVQVGAGAAALVSTQASTKIYRSRRGAGADLHARVDENGLLVLLPDPVVCFAGAIYRQTQQFDLAPGASLAVVDWMSSGRRMSGERWAFLEYSARLTVRSAGRLLVHDVVALRAEDGSLAARMGRFDILGVVALVGPALHETAEAVVARLGGTPIRNRGDLLVAATALEGAGCVVRLAGRSTEQVGRVVRDLLADIPRLLGDDPWACKW